MKDTNMTKLTNGEADKLEGLLTLTEISDVFSGGSMDVHVHCKL